MRGIRKPCRYAVLRSRDLKIRRRQKIWGSIDQNNQLTSHSICVAVLQLSPSDHNRALSLCKKNRQTPEMRTLQHSQAANERAQMKLELQIALISLSKLQRKAETASYTANWNAALQANRTAYRGPSR